MRGRALRVVVCGLAALAALVAAAGAEIIQQGNLRIAVKGGISPRELPRHGRTPVAVRVSGRISTADSSRPPQLRRVEIAINRHGRISGRGLPRCRIEQIQPASGEDALRSCRRSLVGEGRFSADVVLPEQSPFPSRGRVLAFNGSAGGRPAILAHVYGRRPVPVSYVLPFQLRRARGTFGTVLSASLPEATSDWGFVTGLSINLNRSYRYRGRQMGFVSAGCPAPAGFPGAVFPLVRAEFAFAGGRTMRSTLTRSCRVRG